MGLQQDARGQWREGDWQQTFTGVQFWACDPKPEDFRIRDIAHGLSNMCRFSGQTRVFYSVAQHSVLVAAHVVSDAALGEASPRRLLRLRRRATLHDGPEAYITDLPRPVKRHVPEYGHIESGIEKSLFERYEVYDPLESDRALYLAVKRSDMRALYTERRDVMGPPPAPWTDAQGADAEPWSDRIVPWTPMVAEAAFRVVASDVGVEPETPPSVAEVVMGREVLRHLWEEPKRAAVSLVEHRGLVLNVWNDRYEGWGLPGGLIEAGETSAQAQSRELLEETAFVTHGRVLVWSGPTALGGLEPKPGRATHVDVYRTDASPAVGEGALAQRFPAGPEVRWTTRAQFLAESPFGKLYERVFADLDRGPA